MSFSRVEDKMSKKTRSDNSLNVDAVSSAVQRAAMQPCVAMNRPACDGCEDEPSGETLCKRLR